MINNYIVFSTVVNIFLTMDHKIIFYFNHLLSILNQLQIMGLWHGNLKVSQMKVVNLLLHQIISYSSRLNYFNNLKFRVGFNGSCLKADIAGFNSKKINVHFVFEIKS